LVVGDFFYVVTNRKLWWLIPPSLYFSDGTNMKFLDFYWFQQKVGLGTLSVVGMIAAYANTLGSI